MHNNIASGAISRVNRIVRFAGMAFVVAGATLLATDARAQRLAMALDPSTGSIAYNAVSRQDAAVSVGEASAVPATLHRQVVDYPTSEAPGTIIVDTPHTYLYLVLGGGKAIRYGIGVGRDGFTWSGVKSIERKTEWPDWIPPSEMLERQPYLPRFMAGGPGNPLGARAMYLSGTVYRIHGTNKPSSIGQHVSSGCIRMLNADVINLYARTRVGTKVVVLPMNHPHLVQASPFAASLR
jgi:lipoprotein-anchoring transpeptidase ErfK/SrfK